MQLQTLPKDSANRQPAPFRAPVLLQRKCACGGTPGPSGECEACRKKREAGMALQRSVADPARVLPSHDFSRVRVFPSAAPVHIDGIGDDEETPQPQQGTGTPAPAQTNPPAPVPAPPPAPAPAPPAPAATPCPASVSVGAVTQRNHSTLSAADKEVWRTWLGAMSRMDVGPGPDHSGHCMQESLTTVSNNCPAAVYSRGGGTSQPCSGSSCLPINHFGNMWGLTDGPTSFFDMHRTRNHDSLLEGTGVNACSVVCQQTYSCNGTPATGTFRITRNYQAGTHTKQDGTTIHITTGTVTKT